MSNVLDGVSGSVGRLTKWLQMGLVVAAVTGCASQNHYGGNNVGAMPGAAAVGPEISSFLDNATPGTIGAFPKSPWGSNVSVIVNERYFAGSGRLCAHLDVSRSIGAQDVSQAKVACLVEGQGWYSQRLVTQVLTGPSNP
ncbi:DVU3141 family protein [Salinicola aestuarinus]|uniref:DVU3141 family protein n=1 Tax=Salinicola aestuarinus TaxID=1949082 RepID=UPI000DA18A4E|nr:DVU3141 family protein [Salinicola aestuarinus]